MCTKRFTRVFCERTGDNMGGGIYKVFALMLLNEAEILSVGRTDKTANTVMVTMTTGQWFECSIVWDNAICHCFPFVELSGSYSVFVEGKKGA